MMSARFVMLFDPGTSTTAENGADRGTSRTAWIEPDCDEVMNAAPFRWRAKRRISPV
jgi:hypothetical protein